MNTRLKFPGIEINPTSDEWNVMQDSNREAIFAMAKAMAGTGIDYLISGVNAVINNGVDATVSDGFVVINDEVLKVDAQVVPKTEATDIYVFQKTTTMGASPDWDRFFRDGSMHNVLQVDRAVVVNVAAAGGDLLINGQTLPQVLTPILTLATASNPGIISAAKYNQFNVAEQNVQSNWNATSGDSFIQNKPNLDDNLQRIGTSSPVAFTYPSNFQLLSPGNTLTPMFCSVKGVCKVVNNGYAIGDKQMFTVGAHDYEHGGSNFNHAFTITDMTLSSTFFRVAANSMFGTDRSNNTNMVIATSQWNLEVTLWGYQA